MLVSAAAVAAELTNTCKLNGGGNLDMCVLCLHSFRASHMFILAATCDREKAKAFVGELGMFCRAHRVELQRPRHAAARALREIVGLLGAIPAPVQASAVLPSVADATPAQLPFRWLLAQLAQRSSAPAPALDVVLPHFTGNSAGLAMRAAKETLALAATELTVHSGHLKPKHLTEIVAWFRRASDASTSLRLQFRYGQGRNRTSKMNVELELRRGALPAPTLHFVSEGVFSATQPDTPASQVAAGPAVVAGGAAVR